MSDGAEHLEVVVARIGKPHGIRGEVTVEVRTDEPDRRLAVGARLDAAAPRDGEFAHATLTVTGARWHQTRLLLTFAEIGDRTAAETARGVVLSASVPAAETPQDPDEFYLHELVGLTVHDTDGTRLGEVTGLLQGAQDLLEVTTPDRRRALVPFVAALVPEVDVAGGRLVVADRPGLVSRFEDDQ
ncbi:ribosome maturation factor RimM [Nocardioides panacisoli]|uniref:ribosome maturation factor RimM n=1 Tax=Nocardioides panacisoli TaxID=627624 RepID=UPI001C639C9F|nr:ribosome maturation factor RimM [Nocardioides panacisoli]QYJ04575.1 ribosome maturation factor RimM [Nocardioides panacisoli]